MEDLEIVVGGQRHPFPGLFTMDDLGYCTACGEEHQGIEPDARRYFCERCGKPAVYGLEELVQMGAVQ